MLAGREAGEGLHVRLGSGSKSIGRVGPETVEASMGPEAAVETGWGVAYSESPLVLIEAG